MLDSGGHNSHPAPNTSAPKADSISLTRWIYRTIGLPQSKVRSRLRGNDLHILVEGQACPDVEAVVPPLLSTLTNAALKPLLPSGSPQVYRVIVYGRAIDQADPNWTKSFYLNRPSSRTSVQSKAAQPAAFQAESASNLQVARSLQGPPDSISELPGTLISNLELARQGKPSAIARYLSEHFSDRGVAIRAKVERKGVERGEETGDGGQETGDRKQGIGNRRLLVFCESAYSPDPLLLAEPLAKRLRELELEGFRDAIVLGQVSGEAKPEWLLRVDLTPPEKILREWARWGDVQAITLLLNRLLSAQQVQVSALLKEATLHLSCQASQGQSPDKQATIATIAPLLQSLAPQGIQAAAVYGLEQTAQANNLQPAEGSPVWVDWVTLPGANQPARAKSTLELAQVGDIEAIAFLLTRLLNPNLDAKLSTGGIRVQLRQREDLLHVMTDAPVCPQQGQVGPAIVRFLKPLKIATLAGVRIYGRRAGQKQPLWSYGVDFISRKRLVPEVAPEFAASDAYVGDLLSPPGALVLRTDLPSDDWRFVVRRFVDDAVERVQRSLIWSQLFVPSEASALNPGTVTEPNPLAEQTNQQRKSVAIVWGTVGLLLVVQSDWLIGQLLQWQAPPTPTVQSASPTPAPSSQPALPKLSLQKSKSPDGKTFNSSGFTRPGTAPVTPLTGTNPSLAAPPLPFSPPQPAANVLPQGDAYPTFNSRQLDEKIALYKQYLDQYGPPDVLIIGSSRALRGVDPVALRTALAEQGYANVTIFNFGVNGATAQVVDFIIRQVLPQEALPKLILWADGARAFNSGRSDITYSGIAASEGYKSLVAGRPPIAGTLTAQAPVAPAADDRPSSVTGSASGSMIASRYRAFNQQIDKFLGSFSLAYSQRDRLKATVRDQILARLPDGIATSNGMALNPLNSTTSPASAANPGDVLLEGQGAIDVNGFLSLPNRYNPATYYQKYARVSGDYDSDYESFSLIGKQSQALATLAQFTRARQIPLVFVNLPLTKDYLDPTRKKYEEQFQQQMVQSSAQLGFTYRNMGHVLATKPDYFSDPSHLNRYGGYEVSRRLAQDAMMPWSQIR